MLHSIVQKGRHIMTIVKKLLDESSISEARLKKLASITDEQINYSDIPALDETFWKNAELRMPGQKQGVYIKLDKDVLDWMKSQNRSYQVHINAILRAYYETHKGKDAVS